MLLTLTALVATSMSVRAAPACTLEAKIGGPASLTLPDYESATGSWRPNTRILNGTSSKPKVNEGGLYRWTQISGPAGTLGNATSPQMTFTAPDVGAGGAVAVVRLTVTGCGGSASTDVTFNIIDAYTVVANYPPHAQAAAAPASATEGTLVTLDGSTSYDPDGDSLAYAWTQIGGAPVVLANAATAVATFIAPNTAATTTFAFRLTVFDGALNSTAEALVNVLWTNDPPIAALSCPLDVVEGAPVTLDGSASQDSDDGIASYVWSQLVGLPEVPDVATWSTPSANFNAPSLGFQQVGLVPFKLTVTDAAGASSAANCSIFIHDITAPVIDGAIDTTAEAISAQGAAVYFAATAFDAVDGDLSFALACQPPSGSTFALGTTAVGCSVSDSAENPASASFNVTVLDRTAPLIAFHDDVAVEATGPDGAMVDYTPPATSDAVDGAGSADCAPPPGIFALDTTTVHCTAVDRAGNLAEPTQFSVTVHDTTPPLIAPHGDEGPIEATSPAGAVVDFIVPTAADLVDGNVTVSCSPVSGSTFAIGVSTVNCNATDAHDNPAATVSFQVAVHDTTAPVVTAPPGLTVEATGRLTEVAYGTATATDAVGVVSLIHDAPASFPVGATTITWTATDAAGNASTASSIVTVTDLTPPTLSYLRATRTAEATSAAGALVSYPLPTASDLVDGDVAVSCTPVSGSMFALGQTNVVCTATDAHGNTARGTFEMVVVDTTAPAIVGHPDVTVTASANSAAIVSYELPTATDLVDGAVNVSCSAVSGSSFSVGTNTVTCTATDSHRNTATSTFQVIVSYAWNGFFRPVDNLPTVNVTKAGSAVPVKFSLGGNQGLGIMAAGYPKSAPMLCSGAAQDPLEDTVTAGNSSLSYDASANQYVYVWKTDKAWAGTCRQLQVKFADGSMHLASFSFTR